MNLAVGFFDGVHLGHRRILAQADAALTFLNHPATVFAPDRVPPLLMPTPARLAAIGAALAVHPVRGTLLAALIGLIPNCGASVALTELYLDGTLPCGQMIAGLLVSGGVGLLVLFRTNDHLRQNLLITAFIYAVGVVAGLAVGASGILL